MKIKKTVSDKVIAANRRNAQQSTGPKNVAAVRYNAVKHGLLAKHMIFRSKEEESQFMELLDQLERDYEPNGLIQRMLVEEIGMCWWDLLTARGETEAIRSRQIASRDLLHRFIANADDQRVSVLWNDAEGNKSSSSAEGLGWDCRELVLKAGATNSEGLGNEVGKTGGSSVVELRLTSSMETILRYCASLKRDFYRAVQALHNLQGGKSRES